ncbi:hypothetical protein [Nocardioides montaniterrae]
MRLFRRRRDDLLPALVHPRFYAAQVGLDPSIGVDDALAHFETTGRAAGARVTALFDPAHYQAAARAAGLEVTGDPFEHWLAAGVPRRVVPTTLFDEAHYRAHHPHLAAGVWGFEDFVRDGSYRLDRQPTPFFQSYGAKVPDRARERHDPVLTTGMLHRADRYDLRTTSWLEQGVATLRAKVERLSEGPVADLVAKAIALEPSIGETPLAMRPGSFPPHLHWNMVTVDAADAVRRTLPVQHAHTVVFAPDDGGAAPDDADALFVLTGPGARAPEGRAVADLRVPLARLDPRQRLQVVLGLVRGVRAQEVLAVDNVLGTRLIARYGRPLGNEMSVSAVVEGRELSLEEIVELQRRRDQA